MQNKSKSVVRIVFTVILGLGLFLNGSGTPAVPSGTWAATGAMSEVRAGASAALLADGRILITGGEDAPSGGSAALASAEIYSGGGFAAAAGMSAARSAHTSVTLQDGRVLVAGGKSAGGQVLDNAALYNPTTNSWSAVADPMDVPRAGHTASLLADGRVLIAGGETTGGAINQSVEIYNPATGLFTSAGTMTTPRKGHAAAVLADGRVLIAGGIHGGTSRTASTDIFNPETGSITAGPSLITPRAGHSATTLLNGSVLIAGGNNGNTDGTGDLTLAETFDPAAGSFSSAGSLSTPRNGHLAFLLPRNNSVLFVGGSAATSAELYVPNWTATGGSFASTGSLSENRLSASGSPLQQDGLLLVAGGTDKSSAELYGFATVKTDKDDYQPGQTVTITGTGWAVGETVTLLLHEVGPTTNLHAPITVTANAAGSIFHNEFAPDTGDIGVLFYLTATGGTSNLQAQNKFTDAELVTAELAAPNDDVTVVQGGGAENFTISVSATGAIKCVATSLNPATATVHTVYSVSAGAVVSSNTPSGALNFFGGVPIAGPNCSVTWTGAPSAYSVPASVSANLLAPANNYTITLSTAAGTVALTNPGGAGGSLEDGTATPIAVHVRLAAPSNLAANGVSQTQINVTWTDNSTQETDFLLQSSTNSGGPFTDLATLPAGTTSYNNTGLTCETTRYYRVKARKTVSTFVLDSDFSSEASGTTTSCNTNTAPTATVNLTPANPTTNQTLTATATRADDDGDTVTLTYVWKNGATTVKTTSASASLTDTLDLSVAGNGDKDDVITVEVTPNDGTVNGTMVSDSETVANSAPTCQNTTLTTDEDVAGDTDPVCTDDDNDTLTYSIVGQGTKGTASVVSGKLHYVPTTNLNGADSFTYRAKDTSNVYSNTATVDVTINPVNDAPTFTKGANQTADEGDGAKTVTGWATAISAGPADESGQTVDFIVSNNNNSLFSVQPAIASNGTLTYTPLDNGTATVTVQIHDNGGIANDGVDTSAAQTFTITISNENPVVTITGPASGFVAPVNTAVNFTGTFTDPGTADTHTAEWKFDTITLTGTVTQGSGSGSVNNTYSFSMPGVYQVSLKVTDDDGGSDTADTVNGLIAQVIIYDPNGGFVTGGGWINSQAGFYRLDVNLTGKATFGFVSKYLKGATTPTGQTEFQFKAGNLNFHSDVYDWLVVAGAKALYKGTGTINGGLAPGGVPYKFILSAIDGQVNGGGGVDKFRMKIWYETTSGDVIVYDNLADGALDDAEPTTALGGGSIVVHK